MTAPNSLTPPLPPVKLDFVAALLSYLVPGLGQMTQGRVGKGTLFLVALYALFFYGMSLGSFQNVYLPDNHRDDKGGGINRLGADLYTRFQFVGQFPIGMASWPAVYQYCVYKPDAKTEPLSIRGFQRAPDLDQLNDLQRNGDKTWDLGWVYTVIAGVLNVLVIYDALAGPAFRRDPSAPEPEPKATAV